MVTKLHSILRPFLLRRMKENVEQMLPRKKEIILYANMTDHQKHIQDHLVNKTFGNQLEKEADNGEYSFILLSSQNRYRVGLHNLDRIALLHIVLVCCNVHSSNSLLLNFELHYSDLDVRHEG